jgi:TPR repeat protein
MAMSSCSLALNPVLLAAGMLTAASQLQRQPSHANSFLIGSIAILWSPREAGGMRWLYVRIVFVICCLWATAAFAEKRVALVIGNAKYTHAGELANPVNDASDMAAALKNLGFVVVDGYELTKATLEKKIRDFAGQLQGADVGVFFYSGHGLQVSGVNYIVPVDAELTTVEALDFEMVRLDVVQRAMEHTVKTNILFLDACRNNPLTRNLARAMGTRGDQIGRGLAAAESGIGTLISFSTQPGNVALDGAGRNSPYTGPLVKRIATPGEDVLTTLTAVRNEVLAATGDKQVPWENHALRSKFYFSPGPEARPLDPHQGEEIEFWRSIRNTRNPLELKTYIDRYPNGVYAGLARERIVSLEREPRGKGGSQSSAFLRLIPEEILAGQDNPVEAANDPTEPGACDWQTASPFDRDRLAPGVTYSEMGAELKQLGRETSDKTLGCQTALAQQGRTPRIQYQMARALLAQTAQSPSQSKVQLAEAPTSEAMIALREAAEAGSLAAMTELGRMAFLGIGSEKNQIQALDWWRRAAAQGDGLAMALLGVVYAGGHGVPQDQGLALSWARHALDYKVAGQLMGLASLGEAMHSCAKPFHRICARWAELISEQIISHLGAEKGGPELVLALTYPLLVTDDALSGYWMRRAAGAGNSAAVLHIAVTEADNYPKSAVIGKHLALLQTAISAGEPLSKGILGLALATGEGVPRDESRARALIQEFLASGVIGEALKTAVDIVAADMRTAGFSPAEINVHRKVLLAAVEGIVPQPGDADVVLALIDGPEIRSQQAMDRLTALAASGNTNAMLMLAANYLHSRPSASELAAEARLSEWQTRRRTLEGNPGSLPSDALALFTPEEKTEYDEITRSGQRVLPAKQDRLNQLSRLVLDRITATFTSDLEKERTKHRVESHRQMAAWIGRAADAGNRVAFAIDAMLQAQGFAGPVKRELAEARARQLVSTGLFDLTASLIDYTIGRFPAIAGPRDEEIEVTKDERSTVRGVVRRLFDGIRQRNDPVPPLLALSLFVEMDQHKAPSQLEAEVLDAFRTLSRKDSNAIAHVVLAAQQLSAPGGAAKLSENSLKAADYMRLAAEQGEPLAQLALGIMYARGIGVARDEYFAKRWVGTALGTGKLGEDIGKLAPIVSKFLPKEPDNMTKIVQGLLGTLTADKGRTEALIALVLLIPEPDADGKEWLNRAVAAGNAPAKSLLANAEFAAALGQLVTTSAQTGQVHP